MPSVKIFNALQGQQRERSAAEMGKMGKMLNLLIHILSLRNM